MRTALNLPRNPRRPAKKKTPHLHCTDALRACEIAAVRVKCASDDLAARWVELSRELSAGVPGTDLLRTRAWCNVLELRLKERATALEEARQLLDTVWREAMAGTACLPVRNELLDPNIPCDPTDAHWPVLAHAAAAPVAAATFRSSLK